METTNTVTTTICEFEKIVKFGDTSIKIQVDSNGVVSFKPAGDKEVDFKSVLENIVPGNDFWLYLSELTIRRNKLLEQKVEELAEKKTKELKEKSQILESTIHNQDVLIKELVHVREQHEKRERETKKIIVAGVKKQHLFVAGVTCGRNLKK